MFCQLNCYIPHFGDNLCLPHYVQKHGGVNRQQIAQWLTMRKGDNEVDTRNMAMNVVYGDLPSYALFREESDFVESNWVDWWEAVMRDIRK